MSPGGSLIACSSRLIVKLLLTGAGLFFYQNPREKSEEPINRKRLQLPVQNQIPCAGSFGCQRIHVALNKHDDKLDRLEEICFMEKLITRKEAAEILGISIATLDAARNNGLISYVQYVQNGCVYFTSAGLQEYIAKCTHRAKPAEKNATYRKPRRAGV